MLYLIHVTRFLEKIVAQTIYLNGEFFALAIMLNG